MYLLNFHKIVSDHQSNFVGIRHLITDFDDKQFCFTRMRALCEKKSILGKAANWFPEGSLSARAGNIYCLQQT